jgi:hypothetical protein
MPLLDGYESGIAWLAARERGLWLVVLLGYGLGDLGTTLVGLSTGRAAEAGPLAAGLVTAFGLPALVALKLTSLATFYLAWRLLARPFRVAVPIAVAGVGVVVTVWNVVVLLT